MSLPAVRNPLHVLLLVVGVVFVITALACAVIPVLEEKAAEAGEPPPPSEFRDALRTDGWKWLLIELAVLLVLGVASMVYDHLRSLQNAKAAPTIPPEKPPDPSP
jgi:hypothetical protein